MIHVKWVIEQGAVPTSHAKWAKSAQREDQHLNAAIVERIEGKVLVITNASVEKHHLESSSHKLKVSKTRSKTFEIALLFFEQQTKIISSLNVQNASKSN